MLTERTKLIIGSCLMLGILLCILGCVGTNMMTKTPGNSYEQLPRRRVVVTIDTTQRQRLFDQLQKFADKNGFTIRIDAMSPSGEEFAVNMYRGDLEIHGLNPFEPGEYKLPFYDADRVHPVSELILDDLVNDLKSFIKEVPSATFSVEK